jgi:hypothetical protein
MIRRLSALLILTAVLEQGVRAQTNDDKGSFNVRELSVSTGYVFVQLPPITLGGGLPDGVLNEDLITIGTATIDWQRVTARTRFRLDAFGMYTARTFYPRLSAPGADVRFGITRLLGNRWRLGADVSGLLSSSDRLAYQPAQARLVGAPASFEDLAGAAAVPRSPHPDPDQAALFVPINTSLAASDLHGDRMMASSVRVDARYAHSARLATHLRGGYTIALPVSSNTERGGMLSPSDTRTGTVGVGVRFDSSERTQITVALDWAQTSGASENNVVAASVGYGWTGRKWFTSATVGAAPSLSEPADTAQATPAGSRIPPIIFTGALGYRFRTQTFLVEYSRTTHDEYGYAGRNTVTGFEGNVQSIGGSWSWSSPRSRWDARSDFSMVRRPGNFSYIYAWLSTVGIGREISPNVRLVGELVFDRHGSRQFEGFHQSSEGVRVNLIWARPRRDVE